MCWYSVHSIDKPPVVNIRLDVCVGVVIQAVKVEDPNESFLALLPIFFELVLCCLIHARGEGSPVPPICIAGKLSCLILFSGHYTALSCGF